MDWNFLFSNSEKFAVFILLKMISMPLKFSSAHSMRRELIEVSKIAFLEDPLTLKYVALDFSPEEGECLHPA